MIPEIAPTSADTKAKEIRRLAQDNKDIITKGEIFCQVNSNKEFIQFKPSKTSGNQKWKGAIPNFILKANVIKILGV